MKTLFIIFILVPLVEIYLLIKVGSAVGVGLTIGLVVLTAVVGAALVRAQGFSTLRRVQLQLAAGQLPTLEIIEGLLLFIAGALLLTPGFFTDTVGFALLTPPLRHKLVKGVMRRSASVFTRTNYYSAAADRAAKPRGRVIDVEWRED